MQTTSGLSAIDFSECIRSDLVAGFGFVPLIGTGVSAPSGVPLISQISAYLRRCLWLAMPVDHSMLGDVRSDPRTDFALDRPWNPRTDAWPPHDDSYFNRRDGEDQLRHLLHQRRILTPTDYHMLELVQQALGAAPDWRSALLFLSRLELNPRTRSTVLGAPDYGVVDRFFNHILHDTHPCLAHRMLGVLARCLRFDIVLTTNFDDLLEVAFRHAGVPLTTFEVQSRGQLPKVDLLHGYRACVKLHGAKHNVLWDYSLDAKPRSEDVRAFMSYLTGSTARTRQSVLRSHLMVLGTSVHDRRIRTLISRACRSLPSLKVYWVCHSATDYKYAQDFAHREARLGSDRFLAIRHSSLGLLLLELYQQINRTLPASGIPFPAAARISVPPVNLHSGDNVANDSVRHLTEKLYSHVEALHGRTDRRLSTVAGHAAYTGITSAAHDVFQRLTDEGKECVWLDLDEIVSADDLFEQLLEAIRDRAGVPDWMPMVQSTDVKSRGTVLRHATSHLGKRWVLFLNARETPGVNLVHDPLASGTQTYIRNTLFDTNGWLDFDLEGVSNGSPSARAVRALVDFLNHHELGDSTTNQSSFVRLLCDITGPDCPQVSCVLLCRASNKARTSLLGSLRDNRFPPPHLPAREPGPSLVRDTIRDIKGLSDDALQILLPLVLMRRTRYPTILHSDVFGPHSPSKIDDVIRDVDQRIPWLLRRKPGGFIWMHCRFRDYARGTCRARCSSKRDWLIQLKEANWRLAQWYERLHLATTSPTAAFEAIYHALASAESAILAISGTRTDEQLESLYLYLAKVFAFVDRALVESGARIMYLGFSKGRCRRLVQIRKVYVQRVLDHLAKLKGYSRINAIQQHAFQVQETCLKLNARIAREVAESAKGFQRQSELLHLTLERGGNAIGSAFGKHRAFRKLNGQSVSADWLSWCRRIATLKIAIRSYDTADKYFKRADKTVRNLDISDSAVKVAAAKLYMRRLQLDVANIKLNARLGGAGERSNSELIQLAMDDYDQAQKRLDTFSGSRWYEMHNTYRRIDSYRAIVEASKDSPAFDSAAGFLHAAESRVLQFDPYRSSLAMAVIELHRADISLSQALWRASRYGGLTFAHLRTELLAVCDRQGLNECSLAFRREVNLFLASQPAGLLQEVRGDLHHAISALDRARPILLQHERNVWWSTWYFERRLKAIELSLWASVDQPKMPIPFLGLEAAPSVSKTVVDALLDDTERMVRYDVYRLAGVIEAYANCLRALRVRLCRDTVRSADRLIERQKEMSIRLQSANDGLKSLLLARKQLDQLDKGIEKYVLQVLSYASHVIVSTSRPIA